MLKTELPAVRVLDLMIVCIDQANALDLQCGPYIIADSAKVIQ